ncbi:MAG: DUF6797 domain-containing protein [Verrucomicrobiota bacterium]
MNPVFGITSPLVVLLTGGVFLMSDGQVYAAPKEPKKSNSESAGPSPWGPWIEAGEPFVSSVLDARKVGAVSPENNLTPRGLILDLGQNTWACFDTDLLRISAIWRGKAVTMDALAPISYLDPGKKTLEGQTKLTLPDGKVWLANGIYPGWQKGERPELNDPRTPAPTPKEVGRGALDPELGRFEAVRKTKGGLVLEYTVQGALVRERVVAREAGNVVDRSFRMAALDHAAVIVLGQKLQGSEPVNLAVKVGGAGAANLAVLDDPNVWAVRVSPHTAELEFSVSFSVGNEPKDFAGTKGWADAGLPMPLKWPEVIKTSIVSSTSKDAYVLDDIPLPIPNPWKRNVRLADVAFFEDGTGAGVTFDGDVWLIRGLSQASGQVSWKRFASGFHEPMSVAVRGGEVFVYDRNGIWRLRDSDGNGEADVHELFANCFSQTAETREFPSSMKLGPDGAFIISKGGQQGSTIGKDNGMVLRVAPDGRSRTVLGWGFRGPFIGVHPRTGVVTVSDQEGNYVPTTPLYLLNNKSEYHGYLSGLLPKEKYPEVIAEPLTWIPHTVNASAVTQAWLAGAKMGPLSEGLIHFGYTRPEIFHIPIHSRGPRQQAAVLSLNHQIPFAPLNGAVNPADGQLYVSGFVGWGTTATKKSGLARLRYTGAPHLLPLEVVGMDKGILLRFDVPLDSSKAADLAGFTVERWKYSRTFKYGSPHFKLDGTPGQELMALGSVYLSKDAKSVFIGVPDMQPVMQMRVGWSLASKAGAEMAESASFTPYELVKFDSVAEGFGELSVDLTPKALVAKVAAAVTKEEGERLYTLFGCAACHSTDGTMTGKIGPSWKGLFGSQRQFADGSKGIADEAYIRESMVEPTAKVVLGFEKSESGMPNYSGVLTEDQIKSVTLFIKSLR